MLSDHDGQQTVSLSNGALTEKRKPAVSPAVTCKASLFSFASNKSRQVGLSFLIPAGSVSASVSAMMVGTVSATVVSSAPLSAGLHAVSHVASSVKQHSQRRIFRNCLFMILLRNLRIHFFDVSIIPPFSDECKSRMKNQEKTVPIRTDFPWQPTRDMIWWR